MHPLDAGEESLRFPMTSLHARAAGITPGGSAAASAPAGRGLTLAGAGPCPHPATSADTVPHARASTVTACLARMRADLTAYHAMPRADGGPGGRSAPGPGRHWMPFLPEPASVRAVRNYLPGTISTATAAEWPGGQIDQEHRAGEAERADCGSAVVCALLVPAQAAVRSARQP